MKLNQDCNSFSTTTQFLLHQTFICPSSRKILNWCPNEILTFSKILTYAINTLMSPKRQNFCSLKTSYSDTAWAEKSQCPTPGASVFSNRTNTKSVSEGKKYLTQLVTTLKQKVVFVFIISLLEFGGTIVNFAQSLNPLTNDTHAPYLRFFICLKITFNNKSQFHSKKH